jgi:hypothetical protein
VQLQKTMSSANVKSVIFTRLTKNHPCSTPSAIINSQINNNTELFVLLLSRS